MSGIAPLSSVSNNFDTFAKLVRVLERAGVSWKQLIRPINSREARLNLAAYLRAGCPSLPSKCLPALDDLSGFELARSILGDNFVTPAEVLVRRAGSFYSDAQIDKLEDTVPDRDELTWLRERNFALLPWPEARPIGPMFGTSGGAARYERTQTRWLKIRLGPVPGTSQKKWGDQIPLLSEFETVPTREMFHWTLELFSKVRGVANPFNTEENLRTYDNDKIYAHDWRGRWSSGWEDSGVAENRAGLMSMRKWTKADFD